MRRTSAIARQALRAHQLATEYENLANALESYEEAWLEFFPDEPGPLVREDTERTVRFGLQELRRCERDLLATERRIAALLSF